MFLYSSRSNDAAAERAFDRIAEESLQSLDTRMHTYLQSLNGIAAFMKSSDEVTARDFGHYVDALQIESFLPGINGIGFVASVARGTEDAFVEQVTALGIDDFSIHPNTGNAEKMVIQYIYPQGPNAEAVGLDISFNEDRRRAALRARETGEPQLTSRILLVQDKTRQPGFLLLRPVFAAADSAAQDTADFIGWVYAPFVGANLLNGLTPAQGASYAIKVFDGLTTAPENLIFDSTGESAEVGRHSITQTIERFGRPWTLVHVSTVGFDSAMHSAVPELLLISGLLLAILFFVAFRSMRQRSAALSELAALRERQIDAHEEENRSVIENAVTPVFLLDSSDRVLFANQAALVCFGYGREALKDMDFADLVTDVIEDHDHDQVNATGKTCFGQELKLDLQRNDWTTYTGERRLTAIVRDLTSELAVQDELARNKALYDLALEGAQIGVFDIDLRSGKSEVSSTWRRILGMADYERLSDPQGEFLKRVHPDDLSLLTQTDQACISGQQERSVTEYRMKIGTGEWRWMRSDAVVTERDEDGIALRMVGTQTDVTDIVHARNALETSERRFRQVLAAAPVGMAILGEGGVFNSVNSALCRLCGYSEDELLSNTKLGDMMPEDDLTKLYAEVRGLVKSRSSQNYQAEYRITHKQGFERWGLFNVSWTFDKNTRGYVFIVQINDITDQKKLEQIKSEFVSTVSHELRTPLTSIKGALGLIDTTDNTRLLPAHIRLIDIARSNADRLSHIVNDILDLEKISSGEVMFDFHDADLNSVIRDSMNEMSPFATTHNNTLGVQLPDDPLMVRVDESRTRQVLANLISNACKYSDAKSEVQIRAEQLGDRAIVFIQNTGPGVPENFRPRIFQAFSQADGSDTRAKGGTGLGLNITRQIIKRQGGTIGFESIPNGVTVFWFTCPIAEAKTIQAPTLPDAKIGERHAKLRVLHIEDDLDFAEVIRTGLDSVADVTNVTNLAQARQLIGQDELDVVILDWSLPDGDARTLLGDITRLHPTAKIISLSADNNREPDPRVGINLIKSRSGISSVVNSITGATARAS